MRVSAQLLSALSLGYVLCPTVLAVVNEGCFALAVIWKVVAGAVAMAAVLTVAGRTKVVPTVLDADIWHTALDRITDTCGFSSAVKIQVSAGVVSALGGDEETTCNYFLTRGTAEFGTGRAAVLGADAPARSLPMSLYRTIDPAVISNALSGVGEDPLTWSVMQFQGWDQPYAVSDSAGAGRALTLDGAVLPARTVDSVDLATQWSLACAQLAQAGATVYSASAYLGSEDSVIEFYGMTASAEAVGFVADGNGTPLHRMSDPEFGFDNGSFGLAAVKPAQVWDSVEKVKGMVGGSAALSSFTLSRASGPIELQLVLDNNGETVIANCDVVTQHCQVFA